MKWVNGKLHKSKFKFTDWSFQKIQFTEDKSLKGARYFQITYQFW